MYDFGTRLQHAVPAAAPAPATRLAPLAIDDITTAGGALDNMAVLYRLAYVNEQQLRPYAEARWTMPPAQLLRQRVREKLGKRRTIFNAGASAALNRTQNAVLPRLLRLELDEFSQIFSSPALSVGMIRLHATLLEITPSGEKLVAQRSIEVQRPSATADAAGGVLALTQAGDAAIDEIDRWLQQASPM